MPQSNVLFGFLFAAFVIFVTSRGELPKYAAIFFGSASSGGSGGGEGATNAPAANAPSNKSGLGKSLDRIDSVLDVLPGTTGLKGASTAVRKIDGLGNWLLDTIDGK